MKALSRSFLKRTLLALALGAVLAAANTRTFSAEPTLEDALAAPAGDLAQGYLSTKYMLENVLPYAEMGVVDTIHVGGEKITARNAAKFKKRYKKRKKIYGEAMRQRGAMSFAGSYHGEMTEPCARVGSSWIGMIQSENVSTIGIEQEGADAKLVISVLHEGKTHKAKNDAAIVEDSIVVIDQMNSDYYFLGQKIDERIIIRPDVGVLTGWPDWAAPPKREDILACVIELIPPGPEQASN